MIGELEVLSFQDDDIMLKNTWTKNDCEKNLFSKQFFSLCKESHVKFDLRVLLLQ